MSILRRRISWVFILLAGTTFGQLAPLNAYPKKDKINIQVTKSGPYFGLQRGKYTILELGAERRWKKIQLSTAKTHSAHMGFNYNFKHNVLGYDLGYWIKPSRIGLTYGASAVMRTDFDETRVGIAPVLGYQIFMLHFQTGYHFLTRASHDIQTNTFFVSLRFTLINDRDVDVNKGRKPLFGGKKKK